MDSGFQELQNIELILRERGWLRKLAKTIDEQSLLSHSLTEYYAASKFASFVGVLSPLELEILKYAALLHDVGKESDEWQEKASGVKSVRDKLPMHLPSLEKVMEVLKILGKPEESFAQAVWVVIVLSHPGIGEPIAAGKVQSNLLKKEEYRSVRFDLLSDIANLIDSCSSTNEPEEAVSAFKSGKFSHLWAQPPAGLGITAEYHRVTKTRGVLTYLIHKAVETTYAEQGFIPFLVYATGTFYFGKRNLDHKTALKRIKEKISELFIELAKNEQILRNSITLQINISMIGFDYLISIRTLKPILDYAFERLSKADNKEAQENNRATFLRLLSSISKKLREKAVSYKNSNEEGINAIFDKFEKEFFGVSFKEFGIPTKYEPYHEFYEDKLARREAKSFGTCFDRLINELPFSNILECFREGYLICCQNIIQNLPYEAKKLVETPNLDFLVDLLIQDLAHPRVISDYYQLSENALKEYEKVKEGLMKPSSETILCPICNSPSPAEKATFAAVGDGTKKFMNRSAGLRRLDNIMLCPLCIIEGILRGSQQEAFVIFPQRAISREYAETNLTIAKKIALRRFSNTQRTSELVMKDGLKVLERLVVEKLFEVLPVDKKPNAIVPPENLITPHYVVLALRYLRGVDESDTNYGLRRLFNALVFQQLLDSKIMITEEIGIIVPEEAKGVVCFPLTSTMRHSLGIKKNFVSLREVGELLLFLAANLRLSARADYGKKNPILGVLNEHPGRVARRILEKEKNERLYDLDIIALKNLSKKQED